MIQGATPIPPETVQRALERVLSRAEFHERSSLLDQLARWLAERLHLTLPAGSLRVLVWGGVAAAAALLGVLLWRFLAAGRALRQARVDRSSETGLDLMARVADLRRAARAARERGEHALALRFALHALVLGLGGRGALEFRAAWTNRELLARGRPAPEALALLAPLVRELEAKEYGGRPASAADVERLEALCERFLPESTPRAAESA